MSATIDQDGKPLTWTAVYWRHYAKQTEEFDSLVGAVAFLSYGEDDGELSSESILDPEGEPVFATRRELWDAEYAYSMGHFEEWARAREQKAVGS